MGAGQRPRGATARISLARTAGLAAAVVVIVGIAVALANPFGAKNSNSSARPVPTPVTTVDPKAAPAPPAAGSYFGAYVQPVVYSQQDKIAAVDGLQKQIGRRLDIVHTYLTWHAPFPTGSQLAFLRQDSILLLSWAGTDTRAIASGADDSLIRQRADAIKATGKPIFLEWRWEMNRPNLASQVHSAADYIAAWDHIRSIFAQEHVGNVAWVWCPTASAFADGLAQAYYPGNNEVDWVCTDAYPKAGQQQSFAQIVQPALSWAAHHSKPVMIGEYGVPGSYTAQQRVQWLRGVAKTAQGDPQIKALVYFDADPVRTPTPGRASFALVGGSAALQAFRALAEERYFNPRGLPVAGK
jgi:hypothetical protein